MRDGQGSNKANTKGVLPEGCVPEHVHETREEICYVCTDTGKLRLGNEMKIVSPRDAVRIPSRLLHHMTSSREVMLEYTCIHVAIYRPTRYRKCNKLNRRGNI